VAVPQGHHDLIELDAEYRDGSVRKTLASLLLSTQHVAPPQAELRHHYRVERNGPHPAPPWLSAIKVDDDDLIRIST
jgi:hypothetical protein